MSESKFNLFPAPKLFHFFKVAGTFFQGALENIEDFPRCREVLQKFSLRAV